MNPEINLEIMPRHTMSWDEFVKSTPENSIALDGIVSGGPNFDYASRHVNFDHHEGVVREATMSSAMQVMMAIKGGLFQLFRKDGEPQANIYINDPDQDTALAVALINRHNIIDGTQSHPLINRLLTLSDRLDIFGGAFPMNVRGQLLKQHNWVFEPYTDMRKSGRLATATAGDMQSVLEAIDGRLTQYMLGNGQELELDTRHKIFHESEHGYKIVQEIGGNDSRYFLVSQGMNAFLSLIAERPDGRNVWTIGKRSRYIPFPVQELYGVFNEAEELLEGEGWGGSDIIGGSSRMHASKLSASDLAELTDGYLSTRKQ